MKVLIIDDDKFIRTVYQSALNQENVEVELAEDGVVGLQKAKETAPDLILLDIILPKQDGFEILKQLSAAPETQKIPVLVFSSLNQQNDVDEALKLGAKKYIPKDKTSVEEVIRIVQEFLIQTV